MDKRIILAVAGSGKTAYLIDRLDFDHRFLIITYTNANYFSIVNRIQDKFGFFPKNITMMTYYTFLYSFCYKPFLYLEHRASGINYHTQAPIMASGLSRYIDNYQRLYGNRLSKFIEEQGILSDIEKRIARYFDALFIDEIQDFGGNDFNFINHLSSCPIDLLFVGDFFQHTFDTSKDCNVNKSLHDDYQKYKNQFREMDINVDESSLVKSYRCSPTVCNYIQGKMGIKIESHRNDATIIKELVKTDEIIDVIENHNIVNLFYQSSYNYKCNSRNWGDCKGEDCYSDVCVVLNKTTLECYNKDRLCDLSPLTKNKLYVAISRTRETLYFVPEEKLLEYKKGSGKNVSKSKSVYKGSKKARSPSGKSKKAR